MTSEKSVTQRRAATTIGVTAALTGDFVRHDEPHPTDRDIEGEWYSLNYTYVMEPGGAVLPRPPIK